LCSGLANIEAHNGPLATVLELRNEAWMHTMLSEHPSETYQGISLTADMHCTFNLCLCSEDKISCGKIEKEYTDKSEPHIGI